MRNQNIAEDGYGPSEDEDDDYYGKFATRKMALKNFTEKKKTRKRKWKRKKGNTKFKEKDVALSLIVSRSWHGVASSDAIWFKKCEELWAGKAHLPRVSQIKGISKLAAYSLSIMDGKRSRIMKEDLWDHAWEFHFNKSAPGYWRNLDPYWKGAGPPMRRYFHPDGSQTADPGDKVWGGHECCYSIVTSFLADGKIREHYVRINRWPQMSISRKEDWGWKMSNHLYCYLSVPDADRKGGTGPCFLAC
ncbi:uncharacterized protein LOC112508378 [Cynara cardunculus var. scolymus]|uniref:uncharacterized protein LOC112508378 n=1 Tax=Cynara cardunculus var. scolymus TaxID=59895 RepID=UPI000D62CCCB|nr:uncharacterized protein LOC112508378 [Cynara cardunculus var. scolymus]